MLVLVIVEIFVSHVVSHDFTTHSHDCDAAGI